MSEIIDTSWLDSHSWCLRSTDRGKSYGGYSWPPLGEWAEAPDWNSKPVCGEGFHGNFPEASGFGFLYSQLELCEVDPGGVVYLGDKGKARRMRRIAIGEDIPDEAFARCGFGVIRDDDAYIISNTVLVKEGKSTLVVNDGGEVYTYDNSSPTITVNDGGEVYTYDNSSPTITVNDGGMVYTHGNTSPTIKVNDGGKVYTHGHSQPKITSRGVVKIFDNSRPAISGGEVYNYAH
jgi:hypothetical protein